jgi:transcriptional regulator with XRE-family HTH domain
MTTIPTAGLDLPLLELKRATRLPPPAKRREIRERARVSRRALARELGVSGTAVAWWEHPDGFTPRARVAIAYRQLLEQLEALALELDEQGQK